LKRTMPGRCPVCGSPLEVTRLGCRHCDTSIEGHFQACRFCLLSRDQKDFVGVFLRCRGNIREVGRELGASYPTVRGLGYVPKGSPPGRRSDERCREALRMLDSGEIDVAEAVRIMQGGSRGGRAGAGRREGRPAVVGHNVRGGTRREGRTQDDPEDA